MLFVGRQEGHVVVVPSGRGPAYSGPIRWGLYSRPIALTQEGRSLVNDVCECMRDWRVREGWVRMSSLLSGWGPIGRRPLFNVSQRTQPSLSLQLRQRDWHLDAAGRASGLLKKLSGDVLVWLSAWSEVQVICIMSSWCHCHPSYLASLKYTLI